MKSIEQQARAFQRVREAHALETIEDYVELIADLSETDGAWRRAAVPATSSYATFSSRWASIR